MNAPPESSRSSRLRRWWASPQRSGLQRIISPWEYRRLHPIGVARLVGGSIAILAGIICLLNGAGGWAAFFLAVGVLLLACGAWFLSIARTRGPLSSGH
jgi:hypothetical protein